MPSEEAAPKSNKGHFDQFLAECVTEPFPGGRGCLALDVGGRLPISVIQSLVINHSIPVIDVLYQIKEM